MDVFYISNKLTTIFSYIIMDIKLNTSMVVFTLIGNKVKNLNSPRYCKSYNTLKTSLKFIFREDKSIRLETLSQETCHRIETMISVGNYMDMYLSKKYIFIFLYIDMLSMQNPTVIGFFLLLENITILLRLYKIMLIIKHNIEINII